MTRLLAVFTVASVAIATPTLSASAATFEVKMLNKGTNGQAWEFEPAFLKIAPGDTVTFVPQDKGHNSETLQQLIPEGAAPWKGKLNEPITVTFNEEGVYAYKCLPHAALGMVGLIQVGAGDANLEAVKTAKLPGKGQTRLVELISAVDG